MKLTNVLLINLAILFLYTFVIVVFVKSEQDLGLPRMIAHMFVIAFHTTVLFVLSIVFFFKKRNDVGKAFLLSTFVVLVIGCASCVGMISMY